MEETTASDSIDRSMESVKPQRKLKDWLDAMIGLVLILIVIAQLALFGYMSYSQAQLKDETIANRQTGFKNRAVNCLILIDQGKPAPDVCKENEVVRYMTRS